MARPRTRRLLAGEIFDIAVRRTTLRSKAAIRGARLHLVEGLSLVNAAHEVKLTKVRIHHVTVQIMEAWNSAGVCPTCGGRLPRV